MLRSVISYVPSESLLALRRLKDLPLRLRHSPHEVDFKALQNLVSGTPVIIDVGANRGQSIESFRAVLDKSIIHAIEPNPSLAIALRKRYPDVTVHNIGLDASPGERTLYVPRYGHTLWDTRASLLPEQSQQFLCSDNFMWFNQKRGHLEAFSVPISTLDELNIEADILKIDAEGLEEQILRGASVLLRLQLIVIVESPNDSTIKLLSEQGYEPFAFDGSRLISGKGQLNTLFLPKRVSA